jgi:hypothetical protein
LRVSRVERSRRETQEEREGRESKREREESWSERLGGWETKARLNHVEGGNLCRGSNAGPLAAIGLQRAAAQCLGQPVWRRGGLGGGPILGRPVSCAALGTVWMRLDAERCSRSGSDSCSDGVQVEEADSPLGMSLLWWMMRVARQ